MVFDDLYSYFFLSCWLDSMALVDTSDLHPPEGFRREVTDDAEKNATKNRLRRLFEIPLEPSYGKMVFESLSRKNEKNYLL